MRESIRNAYDHLLVGCLLPLLVHGVRSRLSEHADETEDADTGAEASNDTPEDAGVGARGILSTGTVGTESDPVSYINSMLAFLNHGCDAMAASV